MKGHTKGKKRVKNYSKYFEEKGVKSLNFSKVSSISKVCENSLNTWVRFETE